VIDTAGFNVTIGQVLQHSVISGDFLVDGGLRKNGAGTLTLNAVNTYTGNTIVNAGTLALGSAGSIANSRSITVASGALFDVSAVAGGFTLGAAQTLSGGGAINGTISSSGTISPGTTGGTTGTLTFDNPPVLNGVALLKVNRSNGTLQNDLVLLPSSEVTYGGTLTVSSIGDPLQAGDTFQLFSATGYGGSFTATNLPTLNPGLAWSNSLAVNGSIAVVSTVSLVPTNILVGLSGTTLTLSWPADHSGWRLLMQTNNLGLGISAATNDWMTVPNSQLTNQLTLPFNTTLPGEYFRLVFP
jgi:fibronectin-binding autotransporter adhesin